MINKHINHNLKLLATWFRANKISLNKSKTKILLFRPKSKRNITKHLNFRISGQYIPQKTQVKYLGLIINEHLDQDLHFSQLKKKVNRGIGLLGKIRHFIPNYLLKTLYFSLLNSNLIYVFARYGDKIKMKNSRRQKTSRKSNDNKFSPLKCCS